MKKITFAIDTAPAAIPVNPKIAETIAITKKIAAQRSIVCSFVLFSDEFMMREIPIDAIDFS